MRSLYKIDLFTLIILLIVLLPINSIISHSASTGIHNKQVAIGGNLPYQRSKSKEDKAKEKEGEIVIPDYEYPPYHGPKKTVAVAKFDATGAFLARALDIWRSRIH